MSVIECNPKSYLTSSCRTPCYLTCSGIPSRHDSLIRPSIRIDTLRCLLLTDQPFEELCGTTCFWDLLLGPLSGLIRNDWLVDEQEFCISSSGWFLSHAFSQLEFESGSCNIVKQTRILSYALFLKLPETASIFMKSCLGILNRIDVVTDAILGVVNEWTIHTKNIGFHINPCLQELVKSCKALHMVHNYY